ncbi:MAG: chorismate-binding protein, partial [Chloroflexi bacterium]|nr:chorismate-binding protein [Chloroflexota bacterium]
MYYPSLAQVKELKDKGNIVPIYREVMADTETPVSAYRKVAHEPYSFLLESVEGGERLARYSFIGTEPYLVLKLHNGIAYARQNGYKQTLAFRDPLKTIESYLSAYQLVETPDLPRFCGGAVGYISYDAIRYFEDIDMQAADGFRMPDAVFMFVDTLLVFDHLKHKIKIVSHVHLDGDVQEAYEEAVARIERLAARLGDKESQPPYPPYQGDFLEVPPDKGDLGGSDGRPTPLAPLVRGEPIVSFSNPPQADHAPAGANEYHPVSEQPVFRANVEQADFEAMVQRAKEYVRDGDIIQVVLSQRLARPTPASPFNIYRALRSINPAPYMYYLHLDEFDIAGASPELLVRVEDGVVTTHPIAGTRTRGATAAEDAALAAELQADEKERAEHVMLVDLGRNDVGRVSVPGTVGVTQLMGVERYSHVLPRVSPL